MPDPASFDAGRLADGTATALEAGGRAFDPAAWDSLPARFGEAAGDLGRLGLAVGGAGLGLGLGLGAGGYGLYRLVRHLRGGQPRTPPPAQKQAAGWPPTGGRPPAPGMPRTTVAGGALFMGRPGDSQNAISPAAQRSRAQLDRYRQSIGLPPVNTPARPVVIPSTPPPGPAAGVPAAAPRPQHPGLAAGLTPQQIRSQDLDARTRAVLNVTRLPAAGPAAATPRPAADPWGATATPHDPLPPVAAPQRPAAPAPVAARLGQQAAGLGTLKPAPASPPGAARPTPASPQPPTMGGGAAGPTPAGPLGGLAANRRLGRGTQLLRGTATGGEQAFPFGAPTGGGLPDLRGRVPAAPVRQPPPAEAPPAASPLQGGAAGLAGRVGGLAVARNRGLRTQLLRGTSAGGEQAFPYDATGGGLPDLRGRVPSRGAR